MSHSEVLTSPGTGRPLTKRGEATRRRVLEAAEAVFAEYGYHEASIVEAHRACRRRTRHVLPVLRQQTVGV